jgi:hypothetical protein
MKVDVDRRDRWRRDALQHHCRLALQHHCRLAAETMNPKLRRWITSGVSLTLSVNSGYE